MNAWGLAVSLGAVFAAVILSLAMPNRFRSKCMGVSVAFASVIGIILYGLGYASLNLAFPVALLRALLAVSRMFAGINDFDAVQSAPCFRSMGVVVLFWLAHFLGFYFTASATIAALGGRLLSSLRLMLFRREKLNLIFGTDADAVEYGKQLAKDRKRAVVFIGDAPGPGLAEAIQGMGAIRRPECSRKLLRNLGIRNPERVLEAAALGENGEENLSAMQKLLEDLDQEGVSPDRTRLLLSGVPEILGRELQAPKGGKGFGDVFLFDRYELAARYLIRKYPPCSLISFDETGRARENFRLLLFGFGRMGQAALRSVIMNSQFVGSTFRADVFDTRGTDVGGRLFHPDSPARQAFDIRFHEGDEGSHSLYRFLEEEGDALTLILLCTGSEKENLEICGDLIQWYGSPDRMPRIVLCTAGNVCAAREKQRFSLFADALPDLETMDRMAMTINQAYHTEDTRGAAEQWKDCDYFSRMSCRASADFYPAVLRVAGVTPEQVLSGQWPPPEPMLRVLGENEHRRWNAFHLMMGYAPMPEAEWQERAEAFRQGTLQGRLSRNEVTRHHDCLIPWEALPEQSRKDSRVMGKTIDYQQMDVDNVLVLPRILRAAGGEQESL